MTHCSIIVPVYNTESFLEKSISSIQVQTDCQLEIEIVDDGSYDSSPEICDEKAIMDSRVISVHKKNEGVSLARNVGINLSNGEYLGFVDADDTVSKDMFEVLYSKAKETDADVVMCDAKTVNMNKNTEEEDTITQLKGSATLNKADIYPSLLQEMAGSACRCIYKRDLIEKHQIVFPVGVKFSEDRIFNILAMGFANKIEYIKIPYYNRLVHNESCVMSFHQDYYERVKKAYFATNMALDNAWEGKEEYKKAYSSQLTVGAMCSVYNYYYKTSSFSFFERMKKTKQICDDRELIDSIVSCDNIGWKDKLFLKKRVVLLGIVAKLANMKHNR